MRESITYSNVRPHESRENLVERIFMSGDWQNVHVTSNKRILTLDELERNYSRSDTFYIFETATINGFTNGSNAELTEVLLDEENILEGDIRAIACTPLEDERIENIMDDTGEHYIGQIFDNRLLLFTGLQNIKSRVIEEFFTNRFGLHAVSDTEYFALKLEKMFNNQRRNTLSQAQQRMRNAENAMNQAYNTYIQQHNQYIDNKAMIEGIGEYEGREKEQFLNQIERILRSSNVDSVEILEDRFKVITKPLYMGIWNIGQYIIEYRVGDSKPSFFRLTPPRDGSPSIHAGSGHGESSRNYVHPHVNGNSPCTGNFSQYLRFFWDRDMLTGVNHAIQYLKSYSQAGGPYNSLSNWLRGLGYGDDARIVANMGVSQVDNGTFLVHGQEVTEEWLRERGCTGEIRSAEEHFEEIQEREGTLQDWENVVYHTVEEWREIGQ
jgi:hypothetical protein